MNPWLNKALSMFAPALVSELSLTCHKPRGATSAELHARAASIPGHSQAAIERGSVLLAGVGGLGSPMAETLCRAGVGELHIFDPDVVEVSNLSRQRYGRGSVGHPKVVELARHLSSHTASGTEVLAYRMRVEEQLERGLIRAPDVFTGSLDSDASRLSLEEAGIALGRSVVTLGLDAESRCGYVFVSIRSTAANARGCLCCHLGEDARATAPQPCDEATAWAPLSELVAARASHAVLLLLQGRAPSWQLALCRPDGATETYRTVNARQGCSLCSRGGEPQNGS